MDEDEEKKILRTESQVELKIHEAKAVNELENEWRSGCLTADRRAISYFTTLFISLIIIGFCIVRLSNDVSCSENEGLMALLTFVIGIYIKAPSL